MNHRSLAFRLAGWYALLLGATFALVGTVMFYGTDQFVRANLGSSLRRRSEQVEQILQQPTLLSDSTLADEIHTRVAPEFNNRFVRVTRAPAVPVYRSAALAGIVWMLFATHSTLSVPALTGAIMTMGVATAKGVLVVSFARERLLATGDALQAALEAGVSRLRPVLMTALAMIVGMAPMALSLGEGGEQNAPLGRAVIGGLILATCATLLFVPVVFSLVHANHKPNPATPPLATGGEAHAQ